MNAPMRTGWRSVGLVALAMLPGALTVALAFRTGAYYPGATAVGTLLLTALLIGRVLLARQPFEGFNVALGVALGAMALFGAWQLASAAWSDSSARAMTEFDRSLLYLLTLAFFGSLPRTPRTVRWMVIGLAAGTVAISAAGLITRTLPDVWAAPPERVAERWSYPIGYWNALGLICSLAMVFCLHLTCSARESRVVRLIAVTGLPVSASMLLFTYSRGPLAVAAVGVLAYLLIGRPRLAPTGLLAAVPTTAAAVVISYQADFAARSGHGLTYKPPTGADLTEAHHVALSIAGCAAVALLLRALGMLVLDPALARARLRARTRRRLALAATTTAVIALAVAGGTALSSHRVKTEYDRLINDPVTQTGDERDRLFNPGLNRVSRWRVALDSFSAHPVDGSGAGTYRLVWERRRPNGENTNEAHSLYLQTLGELGVVGGVLLLATLILLLGALLWRARGVGRSAYAVLFSGVLIWAIHAAIDWDWEIPAVTLWVFAAGGLALASPERDEETRRLAWPTRLVVAGVLALLAITPARLAISEGRLSESLQAYHRGDCREAVSSARGARSMLDNLPEPYQLEGYCQARAGDGAGAAVTLGRAVDRDPGNWNYRYGLALAQGLAGVDPRPQARAAQRRNPREPVAREAVREFRAASRGRWRRVARSLGLGIGSGER